ncbi:8911_t:CDS:2 [Funneliformis mosseae]|uniref:8911_t:CDS:1 n=1 Tax=Funneliformis mosseae TaxID=27381 RepID=A0A9N9FYX4_FUNMO|nr:8911_t:CDS:2 [Funneliformis mosseae]
MLNDANPYVKTFRQASNILRSNQLLDMKMEIEQIEYDIVLYLYKEELN